jgi:predicted branched-subunit amino acid permease
MASSKALKEELENTASMQAENQQSNLSIIFRGFIDMFPLCVAVIPWGILCGSLATQVGLSPWQAQAMSLFVFAGAAQLAGMQLIGLGSPAMPILSSTFVISARPFAVFGGISKLCKRFTLVQATCVCFLFDR